MKVILILLSLLSFSAFSGEVITVSGKHDACQSKLNTVSNKLQEAGILYTVSRQCSYCKNCSMTKTASITIMDNVTISTVKVQGKNGVCESSLKSTLESLKNSGRVGFTVKGCQFCKNCTMTKTATIKIVDPTQNTTPSLSRVKSMVTKSIDLLQDGKANDAEVLLIKLESLLENM